MKLNKKLILFFVLLAASAATLYIMDSQYGGQSLSFSDGKVYEWNTGWSYVRQDGSEQAITLPADEPIGPGQTVTIRNKIPYFDFYGMNILIRTRQQSIVIRVDGKQIYEYGTDTGLFMGHSPGSRWNLVGISQNDKGKPIEITLKSPYRRYSGKLAAIDYGNKMDLLFHLMRMGGSDFVIALLVLFSGIVCMGYYLISLLVNGRKDGKSISLFYLGLFAFVISFWMLGESRLLQLITGNQVFITNISYISLMLFPFPLLLFISSKYMSGHKRIYTLLFVMQSLTVLLSLGCQLTGIADLFESVSICYASITIIIITVFINLLREIYIYKNKEARPLMAALLCPAVFCVGAVVYYFMSDQADLTYFLRIGLLLFIFIYGVITMKENQKIVKKSREAQYYQELAYRDLLTEGSNRTAYFRDVEERAAGPDGFIGMRLMLMDLNNLKIINDNFGHKSGDDALKYAYHCIKEAFGRLGRCYRIGGDEFACLLEPCDEIKFLDAYQNFELKMRAVESKTEFPFYLAAGYDIFREEEDRNFEDWSVRVDRLMYQNKIMVKKRLEDELKGGTAS